ncbi:MAG TPA: thioredoxin domain-containing protein [Sphingomicrobium sp.]|jgi:protein-disulfide isomerase|nr:thioredoxin domain-containing protein [Sphingomicrobium sp.]
MKFGHAFLAIAAVLATGACDKSGDSAPAEKIAPVAPPAKSDWTEVVSKSPEGGFVMGNPDAALKLVEYGSRSCPTCGRFGREGMQPLENDYVKTGKLSYEFRDFPVHGPPDLGLSVLGRCVSERAFFPILEQTYVKQQGLEEKLASPEAQALSQQLQGKSPTEVATAWANFLGYVDFLGKRGLGQAQAEKCLSNPDNIQALVEMAQRGSEKGVSGTPTFFLNDEQLESVTTWEALEPKLKAAGA